MSSFSSTIEVPFPVSLLLGNINGITLLQSLPFFFFFWRGECRLPGLAIAD